MDKENVEEYRKQFFVDKKRLEKDEADTLMKKILLRGQVSHEGEPIIKESNKYKTKDLLKLQITLRYFANILNNDISKEVSLDEICKWNEFTIPRNQIIARLKEITDDGFVSKEGNNYSVKAFIIKTFLQHLDNRIPQNGKPEN